MCGESRGRGPFWGLLLLLGGCDEAASEQPASGGLVALGHGGEALSIGPGSRVVADLAQANASVRVGAGAELAGALALPDDLVLDPGARVTGELTIGGRVRRSGTASVGGSVVRARPPRLSLPALDEVAGNLPWRGQDGPALVLAAGEERRLSTSGRSLVPEVVLGPAARLVLEGAELTVRRRLVLGPRAQVVVRGGGRLLIAGLELRIDEGAALVQEGQDVARGLIVLADRAATVRWARGVTFGPGLLYAPETDLLLGPTGGEGSGGVFRGALVGRRVVVGAGADLVLTRRPLTCLLDEDCPSVELDPEAREVERDAGVTTASLLATVRDLGIAEALLVWDAAGPRELPLPGPGALTVPIALRPDGEPTLVCLSARDCADHLAQETCRLFRVREEVDFVVERPRAGEVLQAAAVRITGRILRGSARAVDVAGHPGWVSGTSFAVDDVPLAAGLNRLVVRVTGAQGGASERRLVVGSGSLPVIAIDLDWRAGFGGARAVAAVRRGRPGPTSSGLPEGNNVYRLLDEAGRELFRGGFSTHGPPQPASRAAATIAGRSCDLRSWDEEDGHDTVVAPALDDARIIEFFHAGSWNRVGRVALAEIPAGP